MGTTSWIIISLAVIGIAAIIQAIRVIEKRNYGHIEEVVRGKRPADTWFYMLLDEPKYKDYACMCKSLSELAKNKHPKSRPAFYNPITPAELNQAANQSE